MKWFRRWFGRGRVEAEMREEMAFHRERRTRDLIARGMGTEEAARAAVLEFGSAETHREECRAALGYRPWDELRADVRFAARGLRKSPGFAVAAVTILALAIGANGAFFTLYANYVLRPLPIRGAERHFTADTVDRRGRSAGGFTATEVDVLRQSAAREVEGLYTSSTLQVLVLSPMQRHSLVTLASGNYFSLLGGQAVRGRALAAGDEREPVAVLSHSGRQRFFPGPAEPLGQKLRVQSTVFTVVGVIGPEFTGTEAAVPDFWVGAGMYRALRGEATEDDPRGSISGLLAPGVTLTQAQAALSTVASRFPRPGAEAIAKVELSAQPSFFPEGPELNAAAVLLFAAFLMVLLIACANLANLSLARAAARTHEIATRLSLGASRGRIVRQLLTESTLTATLGAAVGLALAWLTIQAAYDYGVGLSGVAGVVMLPVIVDWRVLLYTTLLGLAAGLAFGLLPAVEVTAPSLMASTKRGPSSFAGRVRPRRLRNWLIGGQVAASLVLLILGGILIRNIQRLDATDPGYSLDQVLDLRLKSATPAMIARLEQQPGVRSVSAVARVPLYGRLEREPVTVEGRTIPMYRNQVDHRYFETLALAVEGRGFTPAETAAQAPVAVISRATARQLWPGQSPLGRTFAMGEEPRSHYQVIGVVPDVVSGFLFEGQDSSAIYLPASAGTPVADSTIVRIDGRAASLVPTLRTLCLDNATGCEPASLREVGAMQRFPFQVAAAVAGVLGGLALLLTAVGLYSVSSYSVVQRRREIGVYLALGASPAQVMRRILSEAAWCVLGGASVGLPICLVLSKLAASSMLQIRTFDPGAYLGVPLLLALIALLACAVPARRAARLDPMLSLREE